MSSESSSKFNAEALFEHAEFLARLANGLIGESHSAADLLQDAYVTALEHPPSDGVALRSWLSRVLRNRASDVLRRRASRSALEKQVTRNRNGEPSSDPMANIELQREVLDVLLKLPEVQRMSIYQRYFEGLTPTEIARKQNVPVKTIKTRLSRGLESLRRQLPERVEGGRNGWLVGLAPIALLFPPSVPTGLETTKVGPGSLDKFLGGVALNKALIFLAVLIATVVGLRMIEGTALEPIDPSSIATLNEGFVPPVTELKTPNSVLIGNSSHRKPIVAVAREEDQETGSLSLHMVWEDGTPATGITVFGRTYGLSSDRETDHRDISDDEGVILLSDLYPGKFELRSPRGYRNFATEIVAGKKTEYTWQLVGGSVVRGQVFDRGGQPVEGAQIWLREAYRGWPAAACVARTNAKGMFVVVGVGGDTIMGARGHALLPSTDFDVKEMPFASDGVREFSFILGGVGAGIGGVVLDPEGEPVPGALVHAEGGYEAMGYRSAASGFKRRGETLPRRVPVVTNAEGRFVLPGGYARDPSHKSIPIHAQAPGYPTWSGRVVVPESGQAEVEIQLAHGAVVAGQVTDSTGKPVPNARVSCATVDPNRLTERAFPIPVARTNSEGRYRMELVPPGTQYISAIGPDEGLGRAYEELRCQSGQASQLDLRLDPHPLVSGVLVDAESKPLAGWRLTSTSLGQGVVSLDESNQAGEFLLSNVGASALIVEVYKPGEWYSPYLSQRVASGTEGLRLVVEKPESALGKLKGTLRGIDGLVPKTAKLLIFAETNQNQGFGIEFDQKTGDFEWGPVKVGRYRLGLQFEWRLVSITDWIQVVEDETTDLGILRPAPTGSVEALVKGAELDLSEGSGIALVREGYSRRTFERVGDRLLIENVAEGSWDLIGRGSNFLPKMEVEVVKGELQSVPLQVQRGVRLNFELEFENDAWGMVTISTTDSEGKLLNTVSRSRSSLDLSSNRMAIQSPVGQVNIELSTDNGLSAAASFEVTEASGGQERHRLRLE